jgi:ABC-type methionine transport system permease subunit
MAEFKSSFPVVFLIRSVLLPAKTTISSTKVDVRAAIVSIGRMSISPRLILNAVGTVDQKKIANPA